MRKTLLFATSSYPLHFDPGGSAKALDLHVPVTRIAEIVQERRSITPTWHCDWLDTSTRVPDSGSMHGGL
jgi:hypothetical protein